MLQFFCDDNANQLNVKVVLKLEKPLWKVICHYYALLTKNNK